MLIPTKQWGANSGITVRTATGTKQMNYLEEAKKLISSMVDTTKGFTSNGILVGYNSGSIGHDGYPKGGNKQREATTWNQNGAGTGLKYNSEVMCGDVTGSCPADKSFASYIATGYYRSFSDFIESEGGTEWVINQYRKAEASTTWVMDEILRQDLLPFAGGYTPNNTSVTFTDGPPVGTVAGEGFRMIWRTSLDGLWNGQGRYDWDPVNHTFTSGANSTMLDNANALVDFLKNDGTTCNTLGANPNPLSNSVRHSGIPQIRQQYDTQGSEVGSGFWTNYTLGVSAPSVVIHGDESYAAQFYRQLELKWDDKDPGLAGNPDPITSEPKYFHGWFRMLGLLTMTGNYHAPEDIVADVNLKVYLKTDKTFAFTGDEVTYTVDYRNFGKNTANGVRITIPIDPQYEVIEIPAGVTRSGATLTFSRNTLPGFLSSQGDVLPDSPHPTKGQFSFKVRVKAPKVSDKVCLKATISAANDNKTWTSNEYPNNCTSTMERNCVDILQNRALTIEKTANRTAMNPGDLAEFTLDFSNSTEAGWLNGGRQHVNFSYGYGQAGPNTYFHTFRNWHNADEAYIDLKNYRASFYMFDEVNKGLQGTPSTSGPCGSGDGCLLSSNGWALTGKNLQTGIEGPGSGFKFCAEEVPFGNQNGKKWDQRIIMQFPDELTAPTHTVLSHTGNRYQLHKGTLLPIWYEVKMETVPSSPLFSGRLDDDWSFKGPSFSAGPSGVASAPYFLIGPNYANPTSNVGLVLDRFDRDACSGFFDEDEIYDKILVEEWDGYTWRRVSGEGPLPGREMTNVVVRDTIPEEFEFVGFLDDEADGVIATTETTLDGRTVVVWTKCKVLVGTKGDLKYEVRAKGTCPSFTSVDVDNVAWIYSSTDSPISDNALINITCDPVPPPVTGTTMTKTADKLSYSIGEEVEYTIEFEQTIGSISQPPLTASNRWTPIDPGLPNFTPTAIDFDVAASPGKFLYENRSHGTNGTLIVDVDHDGQENFGLAFRHTGGTRQAGPLQGLYLDFQLGYWGSQANITLYQNGVAIGSVAQKAYASPFTNATIKVELVDDVMNIWINNISGLPFQTFSGITNLNPGYVGFAQGDRNRSSGIYSKPKITAWNAAFDSAFNLEMKDLLPAELTYVSSSNSGAHASRVVTWPRLNGPILNGTIIERTVIAEVTSCTNGSITNLATATALGYPVDNFGAVSTVRCVSTGCIAPDITTLSTIHYCKGAEIDISSILDNQQFDDANNTAVNFYIVDENDIDISTTSDFSVTNSQSIFLHAVTSDPSCDDIAEIMIEYHEKPTALLSSDKTASCGIDEFEIFINGTPNAMVTYQINNSLPATTVLNIAGENPSPILYTPSTTGRFNVYILEVEDEFYKSQCN